MKLIYYIVLLTFNYLTFFIETLVFILVTVYKIIFKVLQYIIKSLFFIIESFFKAVYKTGSLFKRNNVKKILSFHKLFRPKRSTFTPIKRHIKKINSKKNKRISVLRIEYFLIGFVFAITVMFTEQAYQFVISLPSPKSIGKVNYSLTTHIYDRNGTVLYDIYHDQNRTPVKLTELPKFVYQSTISIEDKDFYSHRGISFVSGIGRALKEIVVNKSLQGGSTITQQLVKSALLTPERTLERKFKEIILAIWAERLYSKNQILEMYLNQVPYGGSAYGVEEASKTFFGKSAKDLSIDEAAILAGLPQAPSTYSPFVNPKQTLQRRNEVLLAMYQQKYITKQQYDENLKKEVRVLPPEHLIRAPHFVFYTRAMLDHIYGERTVEEGGLRIKTSLDVKLQEKLEDILREELEKVKNLNVTNGAILVTKPKTGEILAMVGSEDYFKQPYGAFNVTTALRQPGSSIKPLMYSLAIEKGVSTAATVIDDVPIAFVVPGAETYRPVNYDGRFHGKVPLRYALANSYNIPAVRTLNALGVDSFVNFAKSLGISTWNDSTRFGLSLTLGGGEVTMLDMAKAYGVFATLGERVELSPFLQVDNNNGDMMIDSTHESQRVLSEGTSYIISDILSDNIARQQAFGPRSQLEISGYKVAVKTGTTDSKKDNWTIGYTPEYVVTVWVGNNDNSPMNPALTSGVTGAAPIWNRAMTYILSTYSSKNTWFDVPGSVVTKDCYGNRKEYFLRGTEGVACNQINTSSPTPSVSP